MGNFNAFALYTIRFALFRKELFIKFNALMFYVLFLEFLLLTLIRKRHDTEFRCIRITVPLKRWSTVTVFLIIALGLAGCKKTIKSEISFYYWKTTFDISEKEKDVLRDNSISKIYVRYFDLILKDKVPVPLSPVHFKEIPEIKIVPVLFIKNDVFLEPSTNLSVLSDKTWTLMEEISSDNKLTYSEFQLDCDWTMRSRDNYFQFIELLKAKSSKNISATIRLHQIKYFRGTGVPPVDSGVLMYYNMGRLAPDTLNSIYERGIALDYIKSLKNYPLRLNIALPIYSWAVHIRNNRVINLINKVDKDNFISDSNFFLNRDNQFYVKVNNLKSGSFFEKGDIIKIESVSADALEEMCHDLRKNISSTPNEIIFYDLDAFNLEKYNHGKNFFQKVCDLF